MSGLIEKTISCPYCAEPQTVLIDPSVAEQEYIEDCQICCRPIRFLVDVWSDDDASVQVQDENDV